MLTMSSCSPANALPEIADNKSPAHDKVMRFTGKSSLKCDGVKYFYVFNRFSKVQKAGQEVCRLMARKKL
ncbi:MAG: hypothetical protein CMK83_20800 [Pseudomonadales bacterium]|nr:hypothetical protein [Pseudomonadales bacterium]TNC90506.1 MAG: hypothetical protein CSH49_02825 [Alcanivorax sp.]HAG97085.1 hypothetical protein [Gammaproteobacteria bacterium]MAQ26654.1 hypothetical protein [Pseudomonadales bacterium]MBI26387.1 hypothetical protein [Pseudomonadales bacterium]